MKTIQFTPIGIIHSPFREPAGTPIQASAARDCQGTVEVFPEYCEGLTDIGEFSHLILLYAFHRVKGNSLVVQPFMDDRTHGVFATRAPNRPNPIGISVVTLVKRDESGLIVKDLDVLDGTPLLDIKPFVPAFDHRENVTIGWLQSQISKLSGTLDDGRFT